MRGDGFQFQALPGWTVARPPRAVVARRGDGAVSVTTFALRKPYDPAQFDAAAKSLDRVAAKLAKAAGAALDDSETLTVGGRRFRAYRYGGKRIGFVLAGSREYQLFCRLDDDACDLLFHTFTLTGPQA